MAVENNATLKMAATGSISGFSGITLPDGTQLTEENFSVSQLMAYLRAFDATYSPARIRGLEQVVASHIRDFNNPHQDNISMLTSDLAGTLLRKYVPGTAPKDFPLVSVEAAFVDVGSVLVPMTFARDGELNVINRQGYLQYIGANQPCVDWQEGYPMLPCWGAKNQYFQELDIQDSTSFSALNTTMASGTFAGVVPVIMTDQVSLTENAVQSNFGLNINFGTLLTNGSEYTLSLFVYPQKGYGSYVLQLGSGEYVVFDIQSETIALSSTTVNGYLCPLPNGWWRIGINFTYQNSDVASILSYSPKTYTASGSTFSASDMTYVGQLGTALMTVYGPQVTDGPGMAPLTQTGNIQPTTISIPGFGAAINTTSGMLVLRYKNAAGLAANTETIASVTSDITVTEKSQSTTMGVSRSVSFGVGVTSPAQQVTLTPNSPDGLFSAALSYSPQDIIALSDNTVRTSVSGQGKNFQSLAAATTITIGSFNGGLNALELYAFPDDGQTLEFLVGDTN